MNKLLVLILISLQCGFIWSQNKLTHEVYFDTDKFEVSNTEESRLLLFISKLNDIEIESISIYGFCDDIGASTYNLKLSQQRANAIKTIFSSNEISEDVISNVDGKGEVLLRIIEEKNIQKIRGLNRKVEIIVHPKAQEIVEEIIEKPLKVAIPEKKDVAEIIKGDLKVGDKIVFENILFKTGYSTILPESKKTLDSIANALLERSDIYFTIQGHVCCTQFSRDAIDRKTKKRNLSEARAQFVYDFFAKKGISKKRMRAVGLRRKFPLGGDPKFDKRVEIVINYVGD
ncbi:OmpA family protein [Siansivirga zeaxanthinifaciens]|uniref:Flagellar motor protein MotB n=1 Tax=Siansivirga zeaxanthinifaciens CC-SAMT-1 TaxID=1454006 RepID=A0A0C5WC47_9FLAO|nr:OmpA family protein [Siansivirga zeaxanthinifaciens]AJR02924.1 flagellar motor protein MotB [Siansivirga zeaxanthinifaciens CC-SAMT-1]